MWTGGGLGEMRRATRMPDDPPSFRQAPVDAAAPPVTRRSLPAFTRRPVQWLIHGTARFTRPLTMGVRAIILDAEQRVVLVRHSYVPGWHLPGGAVEPGETLREAVTREVAEETGIAITGPATLHGVFLNRHVSKRDHVAVFVVRSFRVMDAERHDWEIVERGFFDRAAMPESTTGATRARLAEVLDAVPIGETW